MTGNPDASDDSGLPGAGEFRRRQFLKHAGAGVGASALVGGTAAADDGIADGPFPATYEVSTVDPREINQFDGGSPPSGDQGEGEEIDVLPRKTPESDGTPDGKAGDAQTSAATGGLVDVDFDGLDATDVRGIVPPDPQIAASANDLVEVINSQIAFFGTDGSQAFQSTLDAFFAPATPNIDENNPGDGFFEEDGYIIFDPRARFDPDSGRFIVACVDFEFTGETGGFLLGVSSTTDPLDPWNLYYIRPEGADGTFGAGLVDYPELGYDDEAIYLTQNFFSPGFREATLAAVDKSDAVSGSTASVSHFADLRNPDGSLAFTVQPADGGGYFANSKFFQGQTVTLWSIADPTGSPGLSNDFLRVDPYTNPTEGAEQPDTDKKIDMGDDRILRVSFDGSSVWAAHGIDDGRVRWYELDPSGPAVAGSGDFKENGEATFFPTIAADGEDTAFVYNTSNPRSDGDGFVDVGVASIEDGRIARFESVVEGENGYDYVGGAGTATLRWGDYNGIVRDPAGDGFWIVGEYAKQVLDEPVDPFYGTRIAKVTTE